MICSLLFFQTYHLSSSHVSAYSIEFAVQIHKNREHVSRFLYPKREKVSAWELSDDFGTAYGPFLLVGGTVVPRQPRKGSKSYDLLPFIYSGTRHRH